MRYIFVLYKGIEYVPLFKRLQIAIRLFVVEGYPMHQNRRIEYDI